MAAALWRARSVGEVRERPAGAQMREGEEGEWGSGLKWPGAGRLRAPRATWARSPRQRAARATVTRGRRG
jgi:hypothetical protein